MSSAANVALPDKSPSYPKYALGIFNAANSLDCRYATSLVPSYSNPLVVSILVEVSPPRTGR